MAEDQQFYRQYLQSTDPDGAQTVREVVSPTLLDHDAAAAAEQQAGRTFTGFVAPDKMAAVPPAGPTPPPTPAPAAAPLPSDVATAATVPPRYQVASPDSSPWLSMIPPVLATAGPLALAVAQPELGVPLWAASAGLAALGGGGGEALREHLAGEPLSPANIAEQGAVSGATDALMGQVVVPMATPVVKAIGGRLFPTLGAVEELGPVLASRNAAQAAAPTVADLAGQGAADLGSAARPAFDAARTAGRGLQVSTAGLDPHVAAASTAVARAGATPEQLAQFQSVIEPLTGGAPGDFGHVMQSERQLEHWISGMRSSGVGASDVAPLEQLHQAVGGQLDAAASGTAAAPMRAQYVATQGGQLPTRYALASVAGDATDLAAQSPATIQAIAKQASDADRPALAAAWVDSARRTAAQTGAPVLAMRAQYEALGPETQAALFGTQRGAFERVLQTAWGGSTADVARLAQSAAFPGAAGAGARLLGVSHVPGYAATVGALDLATPFVARGALMSPPVAAFGGTLSRATGVAAPAAARLTGQVAGERARQAGLPF